MKLLIAAGIKTAVSQQVLTAAYDGSFLANPIQFNSPVTDKVVMWTERSCVPPAILPMCCTGYAPPDLA